jgi:hypothetical protein
MEALTDIAKTEGEDVVIGTFDEVLSKYSSSGNYCHEQAHHFALFLYTYTGNFSRAMSIASLKCGGAVYHGLVESHLSRAAFNKNDTQDIDVTQICPDDPRNPHSLARYECLHGLGHGLMAFHDYDVFAAAKNCEQLEPGLEQKSCFNGVFMENVERYDSGNGIFDDDDIFYPCTVVSSIQAPACYGYHVAYLLKKNRHQFQETLKECDKIVPAEFIKDCYRGVGIQLLPITVKSPSLSISMCQIGDPEYRIYCFRGVVVVVADQQGTEKGFQLCTLYPNEFKMDCYERMGMWVLLLSPDREVREKECSRAESPQYFEACIGATLENADSI